MLILSNPFKKLTAFELTLWITSCILIVASFLLCGNFDYSVLIASLIGATSLIFIAKGEPIGQILTVVFSLFYGYISCTFRYWGEMITYLCMTAPMAIAATVTWIKNPYEEGKSEVKVKKLTILNLVLLLVFSAAVTAAFYFILEYFDTPNLIISTVSITTSFLASALTFLRSPYYALAYAANDIILIALWVLASFTSLSYVPMAMCFFIFLLNDSYAFFNWKRMEKRQG